MRPEFRWDVSMCIGVEMQILIVSETIDILSCDTKYRFISRSIGALNEITKPRFGGRNVDNRCSLRSRRDITLRKVWMSPCMT
jgi:hypothetical protein